MKFYINSSFWKTIHFKLGTGILIFLIPFILLLAYNNFYTIALIRSQVAASNKNAVSLYLKQIDINLENVDKYLSDMMWNTDLAIINTNVNSNEYSLAVARLGNKLTNDIVLYNSIESFFIYSALKSEYIYVSNGNLSYEEQEKVNLYIKDTVTKSRTSNGLLTAKWSIWNINGNYYLYHILRVGNNYAGAWVRAENLLVPLEESKFNNNTLSLFMTDQHEPMNNSQLINGNKIDLSQNFEQYYLTGTERKFIVVGVRSEKGNFSMVAITRDDSILSTFPYIRQIVVFIAIATIILMPVYFLILSKVVIKPIKRILFVMKRIRHGNMDTRIDLAP